MSDRESPSFRAPSGTDLARPELLLRRSSWLPALRAYSRVGAACACPGVTVVCPCSLPYRGCDGHGLLIREEWVDCPAAVVFWADAEACCKCAVAVLAVARSFLGLGQRIGQGGQPMGVNREQPIGSCDLQDMKHGGRLDDQPQLCVSLCGVLVG